MLIMVEKAVGILYIHAFRIHVCTLTDIVSHAIKTCSAVAQIYLSRRPHLPLVFWAAVPLVGVASA